ncbi:inorganic pyrophosphatase [Streptococcus sp.]|nr:inorganic pyrophosphatase [Streptococcus sp.]MDY3824610.1 inorganic pyrophosphatase [Streptococcus sp.]
MLHKFVTVTIDRPIGSRHPQFKDMIYPIHYGYIKGIMGGDGQEQDAYLMGVRVPVSQYTGQVVAIIHRRDDVETKWVVAPEGCHFSKEEIEEAVAFQEKYFDSWIELRGEGSLVDKE